MSLTPATNKQIPDHAILDHYNKQTYLGNKYSYTLSISAAGTSEVAEIYLANPAVITSAFPNQVALFVDLRRMSGLTASANNVMKMYLNPTISSPGTSRTPQNIRPASPNASIATLQSAPTASANGSLIEALSSPSFSTVLSNDLIILDPGQSILITIQTATSAVVVAELEWYEL
jgi:hypothetical protein